MTRHLGCSDLLRLVIAGWITINPFPTLAWSLEGHQAVAMIAANRLAGTNTAARVSALLGNLSLADIALCPDEVRNLEVHHIPMSATCSKLFPVPPKGTSPWHFINIPIKGRSFEPTTSEVNTACGSNCVLIQIQKFLAILSAAKPSDTATKKTKERQALSFVVHFIGDVHQPLHAADRNGDSGGNAEHVKFFGTDDSGKLVLHTIWDNQIVSKIDATPGQLVNDLSTEIATAQAEPPSAPIDWALQSYNAARDIAYPVIPPANGNQDVADLGQPYQDLAAPVVRIQVARAGVRLADALKKALP
jgi:hypothetical protein